MSRMSFLPKHVRRAQKFIAARNMKRLSYRELWRRRHQDSVDMEIALERAILDIIWTVGYSMVMLVYSLLNLLGTSVPVVFDHCNVGDIAFLDILPADSIDAVASSDGLPASSFTSFFNTNSTVGYETYDGQFGVCQVPAALDATLGHDDALFNVVLAIGTMSCFLFVFPVVFSIWSGPLLVFIRALRERKELPSLKETKHSYRGIQFALSFETYTILALSVSGLILFLLLPSISYPVAGCPVPNGYSPELTEIDCFYRFASHKTEWTSYYAIFSSIYGIVGLLGGTNSMLKLLSDPSSVLPTSAVFLHDAAIKKKKKKQKDEMEQQHQQQQQSANQEDGVGSSSTTEVATSSDHPQPGPGAEEGSVLDSLTDLYARETDQLLIDQEREEAEGSWYVRLLFCRYPICRRHCCRRRRSQTESDEELIAPSEESTSNLPPPSVGVDTLRDSESPPVSSPSPSWLSDLASDGDESSARWPANLKSRANWIFLEGVIKILIASAGVGLVAWIFGDLLLARTTEAE